MLCARVRPWLDSPYVGIRLCGYVYEYPGFLHVVEDDVGNGSGDGVEFGEVEVVRWVGLGKQGWVGWM